jgi:YHS domain-containing protein
LIGKNGKKEKRTIEYLPPETPQPYNLNLFSRRMPMAICPVCKVELEEKKARGVSTAREATYYFDSKACKKKFDERPEKYIEK